jgi:hypothetical protein
MTGRQVFVFVLAKKVQVTSFFVHLFLPLLKIGCGHGVWPLFCVQIIARLMPDRIQGGGKLDHRTVPPCCITPTLAKIRMIRRRFSFYRRVKQQTAYRVTCVHPAFLSNFLQQDLRLLSSEVLVHLMSEPVNANKADTVRTDKNQYCYLIRHQSSETTAISSIGHEGIAFMPRIRDQHTQ